MDDNKEPEPAWAGFEMTLAMGFLNFCMFFLIIPNLTSWIASGILSTFNVELSTYITKWMLGAIVSGTALYGLHVSNRLYRHVQQGYVQFIRCDLPGIELVYKLEGGFHFIPWVFSNWKDSWEIDETWTFSSDECSSDGTTKQLRVSISGFDFLFSAVVSLKPDRNYLRLLHMLSGTNTERKALAISNLRRALLSCIEQAVSTFQVNDPEYEKNGGIRPFKSVEEVIAFSSIIQERIVIFFTERVRKYGLVLYTLDLSDINRTPEEEKRADQAAGAARLRQAAADMVAADPLKVLTMDMAYQTLMLLGKDITKTDARKSLAIDPATLLLLKPIIEAWIASRNPVQPPTPPTP